jgi:hypothetical protein
MKGRARDERDTSGVSNLIRTSPLLRAKKLLGIAKGTVTLPSTRLHDISIALTPHQLVLCSCDGQTPAILRVIHFLDIRALTSTDSQTFELVLTTDTIRFKIDTRDDFLSFLIKPLLLSTPFFSSSFRPKLALHDSATPPVYPLSVTERFQLLYHSFASQGTTTSYHSDIANYLHSQILSRHFSFDFSELPINCSNHTLSYSKFDWASLTAAIAHHPWTAFLSIQHVPDSNLFDLCAPVIARNRQLAAVSLVDVGCATGLQAIASAMPSASICCWDLSHNRMSDAAPFMAALGTYATRVRVLVLDGMDLDEGCVSALFASLNGNPSMQWIAKLSMVGSKISVKNCRSLRSFLNIQTPKACLGLRYLAVGPVADPVAVFRDLPADRPQLCALRIVETELSEAAMAAICQVVGSRPNLVTVDLSRCTGLGDEALGWLFASILGVTQTEVVLDGIGLKPDKLLALAPRIEKVGARLTGLSFDGNGLSLADLNGLTARMHLLPNLKSLSLGGIWSAKQAGVYGSIRALLHTTRLEELRLVGTDRAALGDELVPILCGLLGNRTLRKLDIRGNRLRDVGLCTLGNLVLANRCLSTFYVDTFELESADSFKFFLRACAMSETLLAMPFPVADATALRARNPPIGPELADLRFAVAKRIYINRAVRDLVSPLILKKHSFMRWLANRMKTFGAKQLQIHERAGYPHALKSMGIEPAVDLLGEWRSRVVTAAARGKGEDGSDSAGFSDLSEPAGPEEGDMSDRDENSPPKPETRGLHGRLRRHSAMPTAAEKRARPPPTFISLGPCPLPGQEVDWGFTSVWPHSDPRDYSDNEFATIPTSRLPATLPD